MITYGIEASIFLFTYFIGLTTYLLEKQKNKKKIKFKGAKQ